MRKSASFTLALLGTAAIGLTLPAAAQETEMPGEGKTIQMARADWDTGWWQAEVYRKLFEELGYEVAAPRTLQNAAFYQAVAQGDMDLWVNGWFPNQESFIQNFDGRAQKLGYVARSGALNGYLVDKKTADEHDISMLTDLKDPEIAKLFDTNGNGKADLVSCSPGWECADMIDYQIETYGLSDTVETSSAGYAAAMADVVARFEAGEPVLYYTWTPNWTVGVLKPGTDVKWLQVEKTELPEAQSDLADAATVPNVTGCDDDPCVMGLPANDIRPIVNTEFIEANPAIKSLLETVSIPVEDIYAQNAVMWEGADSQSDLEEQADQWIADHRDEVDGWLAQAREAASQG